MFSCVNYGTTHLLTYLPTYLHTYLPAYLSLLHVLFRCFVALPRRPCARDSLPSCSWRAYDSRKELLPRASNISVSLSKGAPTTESALDGESSTAPHTRYIFGRNFLEISAEGKKIQQLYIVSTKLSAKLSATCHKKKKDWFNEIALEISARPLNFPDLPVADTLPGTFSERRLHFSELSAATM